MSICLSRDAHCYGDNTVLFVLCDVSEIFEGTEEQIPLVQLSQLGMEARVMKTFCSYLEGRVSEY